MIKNLSILGFILSCIMLEAQHPFSLQGDQEAKTLSFSHLTRMNGLPSNRVREMVQDFQGYIWIATDNGLARYDGKIIKVFQRRENDPGSLCDNGVFSLMETGDSLIWVGTGDGISIYNPLTGDFRSFTCFGKKGSLFPVQGVNCFLEDQDESVWIGTTNGLVHARGKNGPFTYYAIQHSNIKTDREYSFRFISKIIQDPFDTNRLLLGTLGGLIQFDKKMGKITRDYGQISENGTGIIDMYLLDIQHLWVCGWGVGLTCLDLETEKWQSYPFHSKSPNSIVGITPKNRDELWLGTIDHGLAVFNTKTGQFKTFYLHDPQNIKSLISNTVLKIRYFNHGRDIWISSDDGINILESQSNLFREIKIPCESCSIISFLDDSREKLLYIGMIDSKGLLVFRKNNNTWSWILPADDPGKYGITINQMLKDSKSRLWLSTRKNLYFLDPGNSRLTLFRLPDGQPLPIKDLFVYGLYEDKEGQLWIGTRNDGLFVLDQKRTSYSHFSHSDRDPESLINGSHLRSIVQAKDGKIWISTQNGISILDPKTRKFNNSLMDTLQRSGITKRWVNGIVQDTLGRMWLTIDGQGLLKVEEKPENHFDFKLFDTRSGINDPAMGKMARDQYGNIWLINYGLIHINPYNETFHLFNEYNGLSDNVSVDESIYVDPEGTIYLGREGKFETKDFTEIDFSGWDIKLILESIEVNGKNIPLTAGMGDKQTILLKANQNNLTFGYGAICFRDPDQVLFQYMLEGFDRNWIMAGTGRSARYTNLSPGTYTFRYKLLNREGVQNNERSLKIVIKPFFWQTWWFIATVSVVLLLIAWVLFRYRVRQLIKVERLRTRIATDLHDDIGSTLSSISILSDLLSRETSNPKSLQMVGNISKNSRQMLEKIDDIIWVVNPTNDRFQNLSLRIREYAIPLFESKQILFEISIDEKLSALKLAMDVRRNIYLIAKEAINNLVKYSACKKARILFREYDPGLCLEISDDGKGFDVSSPTSRNGLKNMHARANQINARLKIASSPGNGTTIELTIQM